jgi:hypothetical protein
VRERQRRYTGLPAEWAGRGHDPLALTDPDSRAMKGGTGGGPAVCENVQPAVDAKHQLLVAWPVPNDPPDRDWLSLMAVAAPAVLSGPVDAVADRGYDHGQAVQQGLPGGMPPSSARPSPSAHQQLGLCSTDDVT